MKDELTALWFVACVGAACCLLVSGNVEECGAFLFYGLIASGAGLMRCVEELKMLELEEAQNVSE